MQVQPYLFFGGRCADALEFYKKVLGAKLLFKITFKEAPHGSSPTPKEMDDKIMHATLQVGDSIFMCSDGDCSNNMQQHEGYALSLNPKTLGEGKKLFNALLGQNEPEGEQGQVIMPFDKTFWAVGFGMLRDQFGVPWMINVEDTAKKKTEPTQGV